MGRVINLHQALQARTDRRRLAVEVAPHPAPFPLTPSAWRGRASAYCPPPSHRVDRAYVQGRDHYPWWLRALAGIGSVGATFWVGLRGVEAILWGPR